MNLIKPKKLKQGDTITFIAPSGNIDEDKVLNAKKYFEDKGYKIKLGEHIFDNDRYMAGNDTNRAKDLENAFKDNQTDAILCVRGGYGALRIIDKIDYNIIKNNPKIFCGYSDITVLSAIILKKTGLITFSSPMPKGDFQPEEINEYTEKQFFKTLTNDKITVSAQNLKTYKSGNAKGIIIGGNLASVASLCGTDFIPDDKFIFFAEDLNEPVYKIDKYFRQLLNIKKFKENISAIILGDFLDSEPKEQLDELFFEFAKELNIPIYGGFKITHAKQKDTIPIGGFATLCNGTLSIEY